MINQIEIASEQKDSNLASTLAHETRKKNAGRILFLSLCVVVMLSGAAIFTACGGDVEDATLDTSVVTSINAEVASVNSSVTSAKIGYILESGEIRTIGEGTFSNGRININLSQTGAPQSTRWYNFDHPDITNSNPSARVTMYDGIVGYDADGEVLGWFAYRNLESQAYGYLTYSDSDVIVEGHSTNPWRVSLKAGWNIVYVKRSVNVPWLYDTSDPGGMRWHYWGKDDFIPW